MGIDWTNKKILGNHNRFLVARLGSTGSSYLAKLLNSHPEVHCTHEAILGFAWPEEKYSVEDLDQFYTWFCRDTENESYAATGDVGSAYLDHLLSAPATIRKACLIRHPARLLETKRHIHIREITDLPGINEEALRDVLGESYHTISNEDALFAWTAHHWTSTVSLAIDANLIIKIEDLNTVEGAGAVCSKLTGVEYSRRILESLVGQTVNSRVRRSRALQEIYASFSAYQREVYDSTVRSQAERIGYDLDESEKSPSTRRQLACTRIPERNSIELGNFDSEFIGDFEHCDMQTKRWFVEHVCPDWVTFDVGAGIGLYSTLISKLAPAGRVFAFEAIEPIKQLAENLARNDCLNAQIVKLSLGSSAGVLPPSIEDHANMPPQRPELSFDSIDNVVRRKNLGRLDCIRINGEISGVIYGARESIDQFNPWIIVALGNVPGKFGQSTSVTLQWIEEQGYNEALLLDEKNLVLRRCVAGLTTSGLTLALDRRPILEATDFTRGDEIISGVGRDLRMYEGAVVKKNKKLGATVTFKGNAWAYAISYDLNQGRLEAHTPYVMSVEIEVLEGIIGIGCVNNDMNAFVGSEAFVRPAAFEEDTVQRVDVYVPGRAAAVIVRNGDVGGRPFKARIAAIGTFEAKPAVNPTSGTDIS